jgi:hypothetical protein
VEGDLTPCPSLNAVEASTFGVADVESRVVLFFEHNLRPARPVLRHDDVRRSDNDTDSRDVMPFRDREVKGVEGLIGGWAEDGLGGKQVLEDFH